MKVKITVPESLDDIKLKDYQKFAIVERDNKDQDELLQIKMLQYFCGLKVPDIRAIKASDVESILLDITNAFKVSHKLKRDFTYKGVKYGFIPDLENISFGEYIDLNNYLGNVENLHKAMAVMYRPIVQEVKDMYLIEEYETADKYADVMKEIPLSVYMGAQVFFYHLGKELAQLTIASLREEIQADSPLTKYLEESGGGTHQFMHSLEVMLQSSMPSLN